MLSRLQELRKEEDSLLRLKAALHDQLNRLKVEEMTLRAVVASATEGGSPCAQPAPRRCPDVDMLAHVDNEASINQTTLELSTRSRVPEEEEEEEEESDS
ncbi:snRNA-activating protein complex subunit 5 [Erinaceus europaeus]|uniref:snRNA-activating protein complex subunit 5 n=1 Tax=Erinaceus europaeus TaxID=9365 RepID=A0A1S3WUS9_ERIEU|nr:snRNA-activating protein complex subunit 5 [Erinaceus europaeus]